MLCWGKYYFPIIAGLLFLATPFNSEVVNYITTLKMLCVPSFLLSFYYWIKFRTQNNYIFCTVSILAFLLAMLTKEIAIVLPVILFLYDYYFEKSLIRKIYQYLPFVLIGTLAGFIARFIFLDPLMKGPGKVEDSFHFV